MKSLFLFLLLSIIINAHDKLALVIGNSNYKYINKLSTPNKETKAISEELDRLGFTVYTYNDLNTKEMFNKLDFFNTKLSKAKDPIAFFYYSGHGSQVNKDAYLIPTNVDTREEKNIVREAIKVEEVLNIISNAKTYANILFLDACRDVPLGIRGSGNRGLGQVKNISSESLILFSTEQGKTARDNELFNKVVLKNIARQRPLLLLVNDISIEVAKKTKKSQIPIVTNKIFPDIILGSDRSNEVFKIGNKLYQNQPFKKKYTWEEADKYCHELKIDTHIGWRLPTNIELEKLSSIKLYSWINEPQWKKWFNLNKSKRYKGYFINNNFIKNMPKNDWFYTDKTTPLASYAISFSRGTTGTPLPNKIKAYALCIKEIKNKKTTTSWKFWE